MSSSEQNKDETSNLDQEEYRDPIEELLRTLHGQIKSSNWLESNTAGKLEEQNPELIKAWKNAIDENESQRKS